jgi:hypothetical protein
MEGESAVFLFKKSVLGGFFRPNPHLDRKTKFTYNEFI